MRHRHLGKFYIKRTMLHESPQTVRMVLKDMIIVHADFDFCMDSFVYIAINSIFPYLAEGFQTPVYNWEYLYGQIIWTNIF